MPVQATQRVGRQGERIAASYLQQRGYRIHGRNVRLPPDEIDIVAYDPADRTIVFAEVKTRKKSTPGYPPSLNLTPAKVRAMRRAARRWVDERGYQGSYRLDVLCIEQGRVAEHVPELPWESN